MSGPAPGRPRRVACSGTRTPKPRRPRAALAYALVRLWDVASLDDSPSTADARAGIPVRVYFSRHPDSGWTVSAVFPIARKAPDRAVATAALAALIDGPNDAERAVGYFSELGSALTGTSSCAVRDFRIAIVDGTATVRFCRTVTSAGIGQDARIRSQIEATLRQFPTVRAVRLLASSGHCLFDESEQDRCPIPFPPDPVKKS